MHPRPISIRGDGRSHQMKTPLPYSSTAEVRTPAQQITLKSRHITGRPAPSKQLFLYTRTLSQTASRPSSSAPVPPSPRTPCLRPCVLHLNLRSPFLALRLLPPSIRPPSRPASSPHPIPSFPPSTHPSPTAPLPPSRTSRRLTINHINGH